MFQELVGGNRKTQNRKTQNRKTKGGKRRQVKKSRGRTNRQNGGMAGTLTAIAKTALVPFGLFAAQKMLQGSKRKTLKLRRKNKLRR